MPWGLERPLAGGGTETVRSTTRVVRDSQGRLRYDLCEYVPALFTTEPPLGFVVLMDPISRLGHILDTAHEIDTRRSFHASHATLSDARNVETEDLGDKTIDGLEVKGVRRTWINRGPLDASGQPVLQPVEVSDEIWYSNELKLRVYEQRTNLRGGVLTVTLSHFDRGEPEASLFKVPHRYRVLVAAAPPLRIRGGWSIPGDEGPDDPTAGIVPNLGFPAGPASPRISEVRSERTRG